MKSKSIIHCQAVNRKVIRFFLCILILTGSLYTTSFAQDLLKMKSGREIKVSIVEETNDVIKYREYENQSGPVYSITRDKIESITYKKGNRESQNAKPKEEVAALETPSVTNINQQLTVKKKFVYLKNITIFLYRIQKVL